MLKLLSCFLPYFVQISFAARVIARVYKMRLFVANKRISFLHKILPGKSSLALVFPCLTFLLLPLSGAHNACSRNILDFFPFLDRKSLLDE